jgi:Tol biopolymer transport system component
VHPVASPDGRYVACNYLDSAQTDNVWQIAVLPFDGGKPVYIFKVFPEAYFKNPQARPLAWSPDSHSIFYSLDNDGVSNIFRIDLQNNAATVQMTHFTTGEIFNFALAPDGKRALLSRGSVTGDIIIFRPSH